MSGMQKRKNGRNKVLSKIFSRFKANFTENVQAYENADTIDIVKI